MMSQPDAPDARSAIASMDEVQEVPEFILCGHVNLHKSPACAAQFSRYINYALDNYTMDTNNNLHDDYIRNDRVPRTVSEWRSQRGLPEGRDSVEQDPDSPAADRSFRERLQQFLTEARNLQRGTDGMNSQAVSPQVNPQPHGSKTPEAFLFAIQEPNVKEGKLTNISGATVVLDVTSDKVRAALVMSKTLQSWPVPEYTTGDMAVALIKMRNGKHLYVVSLYAHADNPPISQKLRTLVNKCRRQGDDILVMGDLNSHSEALWNDKSTCKRGEVWEEFVLDKDLIVHNEGDVFTFNTDKGQSIIDVTLSSSNIGRNIKHWKVKDAVTSSDHLSIQFVMQAECAAAPRRFNFRKCDWTKFQEKLEDRCAEDPSELWTEADLETEALKLQSDIQEILGGTCEKTQMSNSLVRRDEWHPEAKELDRQLRNIRNYIRMHSRYRPESRARYTHDDYVQCRRKLNRVVKSMRRKKWQDFVHNIDTNPEVAALNRALMRDKNQQVGLMQLPDGNLCTPEQSIALLSDTHFPKNEKVPPVRDRVPLEYMVDITSPKVEFISPKRISVVIKSFGRFKGPGPDGFPPIVYYNFGEKAINRLCSIYRASYLLGLQPSKWREIKVIYIPKPGKASYTTPRSFRPISLMNFVMKIMEKLLLWQFEDIQMKNNPLGPEQFGFRKGRSCDSILTNLVGQIEHALLKRHYTVLALMDIQSAYDTLQNQAMISALRRRGAEEEYIAWYSDFFYFRKNTIDHKGVSQVIYPVQGAPQGGVGSPHLWNLVIDQLAESLRSIPDLRVRIYADDTSLESTNADPKRAIQTVQRGIDAAVAWGNENMLVFSPPKTEAMLFTKRRKKPEVPQLVIGGKQVRWETKAMRYLGAWLDPALRWREHVNIKCMAVKKLIMKHVKVIGKWWGMKPRLAMYVWRGIARPTLTYACLVWHSVCRLKTVTKQLKRLQSLSFKLLAFYRKGTPVAGVQVISGTLPVELHILRTAAKAYFRTRPFAIHTDEEMHTNIVSAIGHRQWISKLLSNNDLEWLQAPLDEIPVKRVWNRDFEVNLESCSSNNKNRGKPREGERWQIYTDGSKDENGLSGAGLVVLWEGSTLIKEAYHLGNLPTVFQSEVYGLKRAARWIIENAQYQNEQMNVYIYTDSQAALLAMNQIEVKSEIVAETIELLNQAARHIQVDSLVINWCKAHVGHIGNEHADEMAKAGSGQTSNLMIDRPKLPKALLHMEIDKLSTKMWRAQWVNDPACRQTKHWFPEGPVASWTFGLLNLSRVAFGQMIGFLTGHNFLKRHQALIDGGAEDEDADKWCDFCGGGEQTTEHIVSFCESLAALRQEHLGAAFPQHPFTEIKLASLLSFLRAARIKSLELFDSLEEAVEGTEFAEHSDESTNSESDQEDN